MPSRRYLAAVSTRHGTYHVAGRWPSIHAAHAAARRQAHIAGLGFGEFETVVGPAPTTAETVAFILAGCFMATAPVIGLLLMA